MLGFLSNFRDHKAKLGALDKSQAMIEFQPDGTILNANENFLKVMGYRHSDIVGKHHAIFVDPVEAKNAAYRNFWDQLGNGEHHIGEFRRIARDGREVWVHGTYNPVVGADGRVVKVIKFASDITEETQRRSDLSGQVAAINRSQAMIQFSLDGIILNANQNFLDAMGYTLDEIKGKHHHMFVEPTYKESEEYRKFWHNLNQGQFDSGEYKRVGKGGKEVWIRATYNPVLNANGKVVKVVKFASDITQQKMRAADCQGQIEAIGRSQAVIHFNMDGSIISANENFLKAVNYTLDDIKGKHHRMFVASDYADSEEYRQFWQKLGQGEFLSAIYKRYARNGRELWLQASYNPIFDLNGKPVKVVKFATDITERMNACNVAASAAQQTLSNVESVAAAAEELNSSVAEIARNMTSSKQSVDEINDKAILAEGATRQLEQASTAMDDIVSLIQTIANQINLLALNATIESARAGEAGRGFSVVASEVKNLANQTGRAIEDISREIKAMQDISATVAQALAAIGAGINTVTESFTNVAGAMEEQSAVTREITANMQVAAGGVAEIGESLHDLAAAR